jgi:hypothetical protein
MQDVLDVRDRLAEITPLSGFAFTGAAGWAMPTGTATSIDLKDVEYVAPLD